MGLVGIPLSGSPICGSTNSSVSGDVVSFDEEELCIRWYQMGLLLPLAQSVSKLNQRRRSPVDWSLNTRRFLAEYIQQRYMLLPHFYTLLYQVRSFDISHVDVAMTYYEFIIIFKMIERLRWKGLH